VALTGVGVSAVLMGWSSAFWPVLLAQAVQGFSSCMLNPALAALTLGLVTHAAVAERLGRNARFAAIGSAMGAVLMGACGTWVSTQAVFWLAALLCVPALLMLRALAALKLAPVRPTISAPIDEPVRQVLRDRRLLAYIVCTLLFHLSNAAMLPLAGVEITKRAETGASLIIAACILVPQAVVALLSPWVGLNAERFGRRPLMLLGWAALPLRGVLLAMLPNPYLVVAVQAIGGVSAAVFGVMLPVIADDVTLGARRFNLCIGIFGLAGTAGAALSTTLAGLLADIAGDRVAFLGLAAAGLAGTALVWLAMPETRSIEAPE
jgi:MFS family permease